MHAKLSMTIVRRVSITVFLQVGQEVEVKELLTRDWRRTRHVTLGLTSASELCHPSDFVVTVAVVGDGGGAV